MENGRGLRLPDAYRAFLLATNGGEPVLDHFPINGMPENEFGEIRRFLSVGATESYNDLGCTIEILSPKLPRGVIPIGYSSVDDFICLVLQEPDASPVWYWDAQTDPEPAAWTATGFTGLYPVAESFSAFMESLQPFHHFSEDY